METTSVEASLEATLAGADLDQGVWLFGYPMGRDDPTRGADILYQSHWWKDRYTVTVGENPAIWNNIEAACLVECSREPDRHDPTVHSLMSYFTL